MVRFDRCAGPLLLLFAVTLVGASPATAKKPAKPHKPTQSEALDPGSKPAAENPAPATGNAAPAAEIVTPTVLPEITRLTPPKPPSKPGPASASTAKLLRPGAAPAAVNQELMNELGPPTPPPPEPKGWPHSILTGKSTSCNREPGPQEVLVYRNGNFGGSCASLSPGFYPYAANFLVGNDAISSIKVGSQVRARVFKNSVYGGDWNAYAPDTRAGALGSFNDKISSIRVELASRSQLCDDLRDGEIALFENSHERGDCVVLPADESYANAESMGIENDSISSMRNFSGRRLIAFWHPSFDMGAVELPAYSKVDKLSAGGWFTNGIDDDISSIQMKQ